MQHVTPHTRSRGNEDLRITLTEAEMKRPQDSMDLSTSLGIDCAVSLRSIPLKSTWCSPSFTFNVLLQTDLFITRLLCTEAFTITFPQFVPRPVPGTSSRPDKSASTARDIIGVCKAAVLREPFTVFRTRVRSTLRTIEF